MTYEFTGELASRKDAARRQYNEVVEKYSPIHGLDKVGGDYHYWYEAVYEGNKLVQILSREYPKPYNDLLYFEHFVEKFLINSYHLEARLGQEFAGDEIDADYIEGLLEEAKEARFFTPGALIVYGTGTRRLIPPTADGRPQHYQPAPSERMYVGSQVNLDRAERIRKWLDRRVVPAAQLVATSALEIPSREEFSATNEREASLTGLLSFGVRPSEVAEWITNYLFAPKTGKMINKSKQRVWSLVEALCWHQVINLPPKELSKLIGETWGVPYSARMCKYPKNWVDIVEPLKDTISNMKITAKAEALKR